MCVLFIYTVFISIPCVSRKELTFTESIQQICDLYKSVIFEKQRHCGTLYSNFLISANYSFNVIHTTIIHIPMSVLCVFVHVCVFVMSNQSTSKNSHYVSGLQKLDTLLHITHSKVFLVIYQGLTCVDP